MNAFLAGYFPNLNRLAPKPTPGYRPPRAIDVPEFAPPAPTLRDLVGHAPGEFGALTVKHLAGSSVRFGRLWECSCACGGRTGHPGRRVASTHDLVRGAVRSCGCLLRAPRRLIFALAPVIPMPPLPRTRVLWLPEWQRLGAMGPRFAVAMLAKVERRPLVDLSTRTAPRPS